MRNDAFEFHNGRSARTVRELATVLEQSSSGIYHEHVGKDRNDFAAWLEMSLGEKDLARRMRLAMTREEALATLHTWLTPRTALSHVLDDSHKKEFLIGLAVGIVVGVILMRMLQVIL